MDDEPQLFSQNPELQNHVVVLQRDTEAALLGVLREITEKRAEIEKRRRAYGSDGPTTHLEVEVAQREDRVSHLERTLQTYDRLAQRPWERLKGWFSLGALVISVIALLARFFGHSG
jgi:hypothetical protein